MTALIAAKADYIEKADRVYANLKEFEKVFEAEAAVIDAFKCMIARGDEIDDFIADGIYVEVYQTNVAYELRFLDLRMKVSVYDRQIIDFVTERY